jgi:hypothetical protein
VARCEQALAEARAARAALRPELDLEDRHEYATFTGEEWLSRKRGAVAPPRDTGAVAEHYRQQAEQG